MHSYLSNDLLHPPQHWLTSCTPLWSDDMQPLDITSQWCDDWSLASVVNCDLVQDPTIRPPGVGLPRKQWCTLNRFRTNQGGHCGACHKLGSLADSDLGVCLCGATSSGAWLIAT